MKERITSRLDRGDSGDTWLTTSVGIDRVSDEAWLDSGTVVMGRVDEEGGSWKVCCHLQY